MKTFGTYGPVNREDHYVVSRTEELADFILFKKCPHNRHRTEEKVMLEVLLEILSILTYHICRGLNNLVKAKRP